MTAYCAVQAWTVRPAFVRDNFDALLCKDCGNIEQASITIDWVEIKEPTNLKCTRCKEGAFKEHRRRTRLMYLTQNFARMQQQVEFHGHACKTAFGSVQIAAQPRCSKSITA